MDFGTTAGESKECTMVSMAEPRSEKFEYPNQTKLVFWIGWISCKLRHHSARWIYVLILYFSTLTPISVLIHSHGGALHHSSLHRRIWLERASVHVQQNNWQWNCKLWNIGFNRTVGNCWAISVGCWQLLMVLCAFSFPGKWMSR